MQYGCSEISNFWEPIETMFTTLFLVNTCAFPLNILLADSIYFFQPQKGEMEGVKMLEKYVCYVYCHLVGSFPHIFALIIKQIVLTIFQEGNDWVLF